MSDDIAELRRLIDAGISKKQRFESLTRASRLMREAAEILLALPSSPETLGAAGKLSEAWAFLLEPRSSEESPDDA